MLRFRSFLPIAFPLLTIGCGSTTTPPERLPGCSYDNPASVATLRENDHVFLASIDGQEISKNFGAQLGSHKIYRQYLIPPGPHHISLLYTRIGNPESISYPNLFTPSSVSVRSVQANLLPHHHYTLYSNVGFFDLDTMADVTKNLKLTIVDDLGSQGSNK